MVLIIGLAALLCWALIGCRTKRYFAGIFTGLIWMFIPYNFYNVVVTENISVLLCTVIVPVAVYTSFDYTKTKQKIMPIITVFALLILRQLDAYTTAVVSGCIVILLVLWKIVNEEKHGIVAPAAAVILPNIVTVFQVFTQKGYYRKNFCISEDTLIFSFKDVLNPVYNLRHNESIYYFGIIILLCAVFGFICSHRKTNIMFLYGILLMIFTVNPIAGWFVKKTGFRSDRLYVLIIMSYASIFVAFVMWETLKLKIHIALCILLCMDMVPSTYLTYQKQDNFVTYSEEEDVSDNILKEAQRVTKNKMIIAGKLDEDKVTDRVAEAMDLGEYLYVFDRCISAGYDTVVLEKSKMRNKDADVYMVEDAARKENYRLISSNKHYILFHHDKCDDRNFKVENSYKAIGIGDKVHQLAMIYPEIYESDETDIEKYSVSELSKYETVYLSGFTYDDRDDAEKIIKDVAKSGTKVVINADNIPYDQNTRNKAFLGITCNSINFENGYPTLIIDKKEILTELFDEEYAQWQGVYINGLKNVDGYFKENGQKIDFMGSIKDKNINFVGINLISHYAITYDDTLKKYIDDLVGFKQEDAPKHEIVIKNK